MNKQVKIAIIVSISIVIFLIISVLGIFFIATKKKTSISASEFYSAMTQKEYTVQDGTSQFAQYDYINKVYIAADKNRNYQIEFYELTDDSYAESFYNNNKSIFESSEGSNSIKSNFEGSNYAKFTLSSVGKYMVVSRINNTVIYLNVDEGYKDIVKSILDEFKY